jgi:hypothetical protein
MDSTPSEAEALDEADAIEDAAAIEKAPTPAPPIPAPADANAEWSILAFPLQSPAGSLLTLRTRTTQTWQMPSGCQGSKGPQAKAGSLCSVAAWMCLCPASRRGNAVVRGRPRRPPLTVSPPLLSKRGRKQGKGLLLLLLLLLLQRRV